MISYEDALETLLKSKNLDSVAIPINESCGYVAAETITSKVSVPPFANSAMDGFAVQSTDIADASEESPVTLKVAGITMAGDVPSGGTGGVWEIMTGAAVPEGYDTVIKIEDVTVNGDYVSFTIPAPMYQNIRNAGEDFVSGDIVIETGTIITPMHVMALATVGRQEIKVVAKPRIAIFSTGKEVVDDATAELLPGQIHNSNSPYLMAALEEMGITANYGGIIHDEPEVFEKRVKEACKNNDIIISTGAVSAGKLDFIPDSLRKLGAEILFHKVAIRPGKPILYARFPDGTHYFGLPGNPVSAAVGLRFFVLPLLRQLQGLEVESPINTRLLMPFAKKQGLRFFRKAHASVAHGGKLEMEILKGQESFKIHPLLTANCWASFSEEQTGMEVGKSIDIYPLTPGRWKLERKAWLN